MQRYLTNHSDSGAPASWTERWQRFKLQVEVSTSQGCNNEFRVRMSSADVEAKNLKVILDLAYMTSRHQTIDVKTRWPQE